MSSSTKEKKNYWEIRRKWICPNCSNKEETSGHYKIKYCSKCYIKMREEDAE